MVSSGSGRGGAMHRFSWFEIPNEPREPSEELDASIRRALLEAPEESVVGGDGSCSAMTEQKFLLENP